MQELFLSIFFEPGALLTGSVPQPSSTFPYSSDTQFATADGVLMWENSELLHRFCDLCATFVIDILTTYSDSHDTHLQFALFLLKLVVHIHNFFPCASAFTDPDGILARVYNAIHILVADFESVILSTPNTALLKQHFAIYAHLILLLQLFPQHVLHIDHIADALTACTITSSRSVHSYLDQKYSTVHDIHLYSATQSLLYVSLRRLYSTPSLESHVHTIL
uniref:DNA ligase 1 n=1 Tax=Lygus hesperus TaxID=30085 RepID=A0A0A9WQM1_LYGHE